MYANHYVRLQTCSFAFRNRKVLKSQSGMFKSRTAPSWNHWEDENFFPFFSFFSICYAEKLCSKVFFLIICRSLSNGEDSSMTGSHRSGISFSSSLGSGDQKSTPSKWQLNLRSPQRWQPTWESRLRTQWLREPTSLYPWRSSVSLHPYRKSKIPSMVRLLPALSSFKTLW